MKIAQKLKLLINQNTATYCNKCHTEVDGSICEVCDMMLDLDDTYNKKPKSAELLYEEYYDLMNGRPSGHFVIEFNNGKYDLFEHGVNHEPIVEKHDSFELAWNSLVRWVER